MSYRSTVRIMMGPKAYKMIEDKCKNSDDSAIRELINCLRKLITLVMS